MLGRDVEQIRSDSLEPVLWHAAYAVAGPPPDRAYAAVLAAVLAEAARAGYDLAIWGLADRVTRDGGAETTSVELRAVDADGCPCVVRVDYWVATEDSAG